MRNTPKKKIEPCADNYVVEDFSEILSEISIDTLDFRITWHPIEMDSCILWIRDTIHGETFAALGRFSNFDKRKIIEFIARYTTSHELRKHISRCIFEKKIDSVSPAFFKNVTKLDREAKIAAFRNLYDLDADLEIADLEWKRKVMAKRFHPDAGGDETSMKVINEAFDLLKESRTSSR